MANRTSTRTKRLLERWRLKKANKGQWMTHWDDLSRLMLPRRMGFTTQMTDGERRTEEIYEATAMRAGRGLGNGVGQLLRPEGEKWFLMRAEDDRLNRSDVVLRWLQFAENTLMTGMFNPKSRFRQSAGETDMDLVILGTGILFVGVSERAKRLQYINMDLKDVEIDLDDEGNVDTVFQLRKFTLRQAEIRFGKENLSDELKQKLTTRNEADMDVKYEFLRVVQPRQKGDANAALSRNFPFTHDWIEVATKHEVKVGGFREFPFVVPRWDTTSGEVYGRSPGMIALPDSETLNAMTETILVSGQKAAEPSIFAPNDSSFDAVNTFSGGITYYDVDTATQLRGNPFFTLRNDFNLPITRDMQDDMRQQVEAAFFKNVFNLPVAGPEMTATEVIARKEEFIREVGAVFGRLESDYLAPVVEKSFVHLIRMGALDPIPEELIGRDVRFEYTSPIKRVREQAEVAATRLWLQGLEELAQMKPEVMDIPNVDEIARFSAFALDVPAIAVNTREDVETSRAQRAEEQADAAERAKVAEEAQIAQAGGRAAKDLTEAFTDPNEQQLEGVQ